MFLLLVDLVGEENDGVDATVCILLLLHCSRK